jgi:hypothetical protein
MGRLAQRTLQACGKMRQVGEGGGVVRQVHYPHPETCQEDYGDLSEMGGSAVSMGLRSWS